MATVTTRVDDLDGSTEGVETIRLSLGDRTVEIDLAQANRDKLEKAVAAYFDKGREVVKKSGGGNNSELAAIREWAAAQNPPIEVAAKGRISGDVVERYHAAHANPSA